MDCPDIINKKLIEDLNLGKVIEVNPTPLFIFSPFDLVSKHDSGWHHIVKELSECM